MLDSKVQAELDRARRESLLGHLPWREGVPEGPAVVEVPMALPSGAIRIDYDFACPGRTVIRTAGGDIDRSDWPRYRWFPLAGLVARPGHEGAAPPVPTARPRRIIAHPKAGSPGGSGVGDVDDFLQDAQDLLSELSDLPEAAEDFADSVRMKVEDMMGWAEDNRHVTDRMWSALQNMADGAARWNRG